MLYMVIIAVCSEINTKHLIRYTVRAERKIGDVKLGGT
jgi:hypothetical protein